MNDWGLRSTEAYQVLTLALDRVRGKEVQLADFGLDLLDHPRKPQGGKQQNSRSQGDWQQSDWPQNGWKQDGWTQSGWRQNGWRQVQSMDFDVPDDQQSQSEDEPSVHSSANLNPSVAGSATQNPPGVEESEPKNSNFFQRK